MPERISKMDQRITWKAEITFTGTADEFNRLSKALAASPVTVSIAEWAGIKHHLAGCNRVDIREVLDPARLERATAGQPRMRLRYIQDIRGGIRTAHLHLGDEVVLFDREHFKTLVTEVATTLAAARVDRVDDFVEAVAPVKALEDDPVPI
jgi:hypothetical protein